MPVCLQMLVSLCRGSQLNEHASSDMNYAQVTKPYYTPVIMLCYTEILIQHGFALNCSSYFRLTQFFFFQIYSLVHSNGHCCTEGPVIFLRFLHVSLKSAFFFNLLSMDYPMNTPKYGSFPTPLAI